MFKAHRYRQNRYRLFGLALLGLSLILNAPFATAQEDRPAGTLTPDEIQNIEKVVHDYLLDHPEVIAEALQKLETQEQQAALQKQQAAAKGIRPVTKKDHILGNPDAPVKVVEFSDFECPFCKRVHPTLKQIMKDYGGTGRVALVYRHFPLDSLHKKARKEAQASECANELGGNDAFWAFVDKIFEVTPSNDGLDPSLLPKIATDVGLDGRRFEACLAGDIRGGKYAELIETDVQDAIASGGEGTPYVVVIAPGGDIFPISGAQPYASFKSIIELALAKK